MDNYSTHKTKEIRDSFARQPRWHVHFTPTFVSWLNQVERFFANLTEKQIKRGVRRSTVELEQAITEYIEAVNEDPKPFKWHKSAARFSPASSAAENPRTRAGSIITVRTSKSGH